MISNEKELENYICNNQENFIDTLKKIYSIDEIEFVGRQVRIGNDNIADLVYYGKDNCNDNIFKSIIIVELKFRELECKDLSQLMRYICVLEEKDCYNNFDNVYGCFVSFGCSNEMKDICKKETNINFINIKCNIEFNEENYSYTKEYLDNLSLDDRLKKYMKSGDEK